MAKQTLSDAELMFSVAQIIADPQPIHLKNEIDLERLAMVRALQ